MKNKDVYIVAAKRSPVSNSKKGAFSNLRPDDLLAQVITNIVSETNIDPTKIDDVIIGCAMQEAEQGMNIARVSLLLAGLPHSVPGASVNRLCASGLESIAIAANKIQAGANVVIAGGVESMSMIPMGGHNMMANPRLFSKDKKHLAIGYGMGLTAEAVARKWHVTRDSQDEFALLSHKRAVAAIDKDLFSNEITPIMVENSALTTSGEIALSELSITQDIGPRADTSLAQLQKLNPAFALNGSVTAGNSSQVSDGAAALMLVSESFLFQHKLKPLAKFKTYAVAGVDPEYMGIGPIYAIPKALKQCGLSYQDIEHIELNEAFAAQSIAVINELHLDSSKVNPLGGAIALGHPLGATGSIRTTTLLHNMQRNKQRYGMVTMCIGTGMGACAIFESTL
jgi:acetyl-CoA acyltransferase